MAFTISNALRLINFRWVVKNKAASTQKGPRSFAIDPGTGECGQRAAGAWRRHTDCYRLSRYAARARYRDRVHQWSRKQQRDTAPAFLWTRRLPAKPACARLLRRWSTGFRWRDRKPAGLADRRQRRYGRDFQDRKWSADCSQRRTEQRQWITIDGISTASAVWGGTTVITPTEDSVGD